jgi:hypothetical protein
METYLSQQSSEKRCQEARNSSNSSNSSDIRHSSANATTSTPCQSQTRSQQHSSGGGLDRSLPSWSPHHRPTMCRRIPLQDLLPSLTTPLNRMSIITNPMGILLFVIQFPRSHGSLSMIQVAVPQGFKGMRRFTINGQMDGRALNGWDVVYTVSWSAADGSTWEPLRSPVRSLCGGRTNCPKFSPSKRHPSSTLGENATWWRSWYLCGRAVMVGDEELLMELIFWRACKRRTARWPKPWTPPPPRYALRNETLAQAFSAQSYWGVKLSLNEK